MQRRPSARCATCCWHAWEDWAAVQDMGIHIWLAPAGSSAAHTPALGTSEGVLTLCARVQHPARLDAFG